MRKMLFDPEGQFAGKAAQFDCRASWAEIAADFVRERA
jgi:hypothetical protein